MILVLMPLPQKICIRTQVWNLWIFQSLILKNLPTPKACMKISLRITGPEINLIYPPQKALLSLLIWLECLRILKERFR